MRSLAAFAFATLCGAAAAQNVSMGGSLGNNALLVIDGKPRTVAVGATVEGIKLLSVTGNEAVVELKDKEVTLFADNEFQLGQVFDILITKLAKRNVDARFIDRSAKIEKIGGDKVRQQLVVRSGIDSETAKKLQTLLKQSKLKVQGSIQGDTVRVSGGKRDELQSAIALIRKEIADQPLSFTNFRD